MEVKVNIGGQGQAGDPDLGLADAHVLDVVLNGAGGRVPLDAGVQPTSIWLYKNRHREKYLALVWIRICTVPHYPDPQGKNQQKFTIQINCIKSQYKNKQLNIFRAHFAFK